MEIAEQIGKSPKTELENKRPEKILRNRNERISQIKKTV
jgi:hypothetical protein